MIYIVSSCLPIAYILGRRVDERNGSEFAVQGEINFIVQVIAVLTYGITFVFLFIYYRRSKKSLYAPVPEQRKEDGAKGAPDVGWELDEENTEESMRVQY